MKIDPRPEFETHENLTISGDPGAAAIAGIRQSEIADKLELYEKHFAKEWDRIPSRSPFRFIAWLLGFHHIQNALRISRMELKELALAHATELNRQKTEEIKKDFYGQYLELAGNMNDFHHFLMENYPLQTREATEQHRTLFDTAKSIIIEQRKKIPG